MKAIKYLLIFLISFGYSQEQECEVGGNPDFQVKVADGGRSDSYTIPLAIHIVTADNGNTTINLDRLQEELDALNGLYLNQINFEVCSVNYVASDVWYNLELNEQGRLLNETAVDLAFNVYFVGSIENYCGYAYYPNSGSVNGYAKAFVRNSCLNGSTFAHELGHNLGLYHTHGRNNTFNSTDELADGSNGGDTGDLVVDTPSDPKLSTSIVNTDCVYTGDALDKSGAPHCPDPRNLLSYSRKACRDVVTQGQVDRAKAVIDTYYFKYQCETLSTPTFNRTDFRVYPNPFNDIINLSSKKSYQLVDINGKVLNLGNSDKIDTSNLSSGIYFLQIGDEVFKLVK